MARNGTQNPLGGTPVGTKVPTAASSEPTLHAALLNVSFEPIFVWDRQHGIIEWNAGAEKQYGYTRSEALGRDSHELLLSTHPVSLRRFLKKLDAEGYWIGELRHTTKDGRELIVESRQQVVVHDGRRLVIESNRDITERRVGEGQVALLIIIGDLIRTISKPEDLLFAVSKAVGQYFDAKRCLFNEIDLDKDLEVIHRDYCQGVDSVAGMHKVSSYSPLTTAEMIAGKSVMNVDSKTDPRTAKFYRKVYEPGGERSYIAVPLMRAGKWKASLLVSDDQPREWDQGEIALLETVAERVWNAVEKRQIEKAISESEQQFRAVFSQTTAGFTLTDLKGKFFLVNDRFCEIAGQPREVLLQTKIQNVIHPADVHLNRAKFRELVKFNGPSFVEEKRFLRPDGTEVWVHNNVSAIRDVKGKVLQIVTAVTDITERKRAEDELRKSEELFSRFMQYLPGLAWIKDVDGRYVYANDAAQKAFEIAWKDLYGKTDDEVFPSDVAGQFKENDRKVLEERKGLQTVETLGHSDGMVHHSIISKFPIFTHEGEPALIGGMAIDITDRVKAEAALRESEERRQLAQEAGNVGIFDWDIVEDKTYWSETMWSFYGEAPDGVNPDEAFWSAHLHPEDRARVKHNILHVVESDEHEFRDEFRIVRSDGSIRWIEARAAVSRDTSGRATRMYGVNSDITARKEAEESLRLSDHQLRLVTNAVPALISYVDKDERYRFANQRFTDWFGVPTDEMIGLRPVDIVGEEAYGVLKPYIDRALSGERCAFETTLTSTALGARYVHISYIPDIAPDGNVYGYYGFTHDLTDIKRSEELLRSSEERLGLMMESVTDYGIFSLDRAGVIDSWNKGSEVIFGYSAEEVVGRPYSVLFAEDDVANGVPQKEIRTAKRKSRASDERWLLKRDGSRFFAHGVMMTLHAGNAVTGYAKIVNDLTEKQRHAEELQKAHDELEMRVEERTKELAQSNAALVHEMQDREVAERERIDLLRRLVSSQEMERRRIARDLHDQMGQRLTGLRLKIAALNEFSPDSDEYAPRVKRLQEIAERIDSEVSFLAWELRPTALDDLGLLDAVAAFVNEWSRHFEISADFHSAGLPNERLDREVETHLYRITQEALNNILKYAEAQHVSVMLEKRRQNLILIIEDDGRGFDISKPRDPSDSGKGLGLIGMSERAALIGGELEIESAPGKGTTIYVRVPLVT